MIKFNNFRNLVSLSVVLLAAPCLRAQRLDSLVNILDTRYPQEKVYLHFDKEYYNAGETIWFKAYLMADNLAAPISKSLFAELLDEKGNVLQRKAMPVLQGGGSSNFELPDTLLVSKLFVRAYTNWMLNFDSSLIYLKPIQVIPSKAPAKKAPAPVTYSLQLFPEGGDLVNGILSKVAYKATDNQGTPVSVKGDIVDSKSSKITSFTSMHDGMGYFVIQPQPGEKYKAVWKDKKGVAHESPLPEAKTQGVVIAARLTDHQLLYTLTRPDSVSEVFQSFYVVAQMQQRLVYSARINMNKKTAVSAPIEIDSVPNGVLQLTIFNANQVPVAERLAFINHDNYFFITDLHSADKSQAKRGRNTVQIDVGDVLVSNLSVSVTDAGLNPITPNEENIYSQLLLSSDLKGYVYNPAYYFSSDEDTVKQHLDLVMLTNGWRRFKWDDLLAGNWPVIKYQPENYVTISGKVVGLSKNLLYQKEISAIIKTKNGGTNIFNMPINPQGEFKQDNLFFYDTAKIYYQLNNDKDKTLTTSASFSFNNDFAKIPPIANVPLAGLYAPEKVDSVVLQKSMSMATLSRNQDESNRVKTLETVQVRARVKSHKEKMEEEYTSGMFVGGDGYTFTMDDDPFAKSSPNVLTYLQGKVAGLQISTVGQGGATWRGANTSFFVNEMTSDVSRLQAINMSDVAMIKIFRPPFFGATGGGAGGAIAVYTKKGGSDNSQIKGLSFVAVNGYSVTKEFYAPDYENKPEPEHRDFRVTLYWNPNLFFDKNTRRVTIPFFNSDYSKRIRVTVEGINEAGQLTHEEKIIE